MTKPETALRELNEKLTEIIEKHNGMTFLNVSGCVADLTALISEGYVAKEAYIALENTLARTEAKGLDLLQQRDELKEALAEMIWQFGYRSTYEGRESLHTGGLSALEDAFAALGLSDPITLIDFYAAIKNTEPKVEECSYWKTNGCCLPGCGTDSCEHHPLNR